MIKMFHYMKERWYYIVLIIALLFLQANCDLALPDYTSKIVNIGIQQKGIEDGVPEKIREESMDKLFLFMEEKDVETVKDAYTLKGDIYELKEIDADKREKLNSIFGMSMMAVEGLEEGGDQVKQIREKMQLPEDADLFQVFSQMPKEQLLKISKYCKKL